jgi:hypothetical protein
MEGRDPNQPIAATRIVSGADVNYGALTTNLLNGGPWTAEFIPEGSAWLLAAGVPALGLVARRSSARWRALMVLLIVVGTLGPTTYSTLLWNRVRYIWPFAPGWFITVAALFVAAGFLVSSVRGLQAKTASGGAQPARGGPMDALAAGWAVLSFVGFCSFAPAGSGGVSPEDAAPALASAIATTTLAMACAMSATFSLGKLLASRAPNARDASQRAAVLAGLAGHPLPVSAGAEARAVLAVLANRDPARVDALLAALPGETLALLETLSPAR